MHIIEKSINGISELFGRIGWILILYAMVFGLLEVLLRYLFNSPTQWIALTIQYSMVLLACVAGPYALNNDQFVKLDVLYERLNNKTKAIVDILTSVLTYLYLYVLITKGFNAALASYSRLEMTPTSIKIPVYPLKFAIPIAAIVTMLVALKSTGLSIKVLMDKEQDDQEM